MINLINKQNGKSIGSNFEFDVEIKDSKNPESIDKPITAIITNIPIMNLLTAKNPYDEDSAQKRKLIDSLIDFIIKTNQPLSLVDDEYFVKMLSSFDNRLRLSLRQTVTNKLIPLKIEEKKTLFKNS